MDPLLTMHAELGAQIKGALDARDAAQARCEQLEARLAEAEAAAERDADALRRRVKALEEERDAALKSRDLAAARESESAKRTRALQQSALASKTSQLMVERDFRK